MPKYLLDSNICIFLLRGKFDINQRINEVGWNNCCISEVTVAELKYGAEYSNDVIKSRKMVDDFTQKVAVVPIYQAIDIYAKEKAALRRFGIMIDDFDLLIGSTALFYKMILVTENVKHLNRLSKIKIENWINR